MNDKFINTKILIKQVQQTTENAYKLFSRINKDRKSSPITI